MADGMNEIPGVTISDVKLRLHISQPNPDLTAADLRNALATSERLFDRGMPVRLAYDQQQGGMVAHVMTAEGIIREAHQCCRPFAVRAQKDTTIEVDIGLPKNVALMYLDMRGEWGLRPLNGIASAPLLDDAGGIHAREGYDVGTGLYCERVPAGLADAVPQNPSAEHAAAALLTLRRRLRTFAFADAATVAEAGQDVPVVDLAQPPGGDESAALVALLTAVCRPSLFLAPGLLLRAAPLSGAGSGKGLLVRVICAIAYGRAPAAVTAGHSREELDKRISAELTAGGPVVFLDNLNDKALESDVLASAITERPARVRVLGKSLMVPMNPSAFIVLTGNGLSVREDLARRFVTVELDAGLEDPETRRFRGDVLTEALDGRTELLAAALTIWRWGRGLDAKGALVAGLPLGSFGQWCRWVRDPLVMLGCQDPARRVAETKTQDRQREQIREVFAAWYATHGAGPITLADLAPDVRSLIDPQDRGRQYRAAVVGRWAGTRAGGFVLTRQAAAGKWGASTYAVQPVASPAPASEPGGELAPGQAAARPDAPYGPYGFGAAGNTDDERPGWSGAL